MSNCFWWGGGNVCDTCQRLDYRSSVRSRDGGAVARGFSPAAAARHTKFEIPIGGCFFRFWTFLKLSFFFSIFTFFSFSIIVIGRLIVLIPRPKQRKNTSKIPSGNPARRIDALVRSCLCRNWARPHSTKCQNACGLDGTWACPYPNTSEIVCLMESWWNLEDLMESGHIRIQQTAKLRVSVHWVVLSTKTL